MHYILSTVCLSTRTTYGIIYMYNFNGSNTDGSFTVDYSNPIFSPSKILPIAQENKYLGKLSYLIMNLYVVSIH